MPATGEVLFCNCLPVEIEDQSQLIQLLIRALTGDVLMIIVGIEFHVLANRQQAAGIQRRGAEFVVLALIIKLAAHVRRRMVGADLHSTFQCRPIAIAPGELTVGPIQIEAVAVRKQNFGHEREMKSGCEYPALYGWLIR